jgi:hypothetical protein
MVVDDTDPKLASPSRALATFTGTSALSAAVA